VGRNNLFVTTALGIAVLVAAPAAAETFVTVETVPIQTTTMTMQQILTDGKGGKPVTIAGELRIPGSFDNTNKQPAVLIAPGLAGSLTPIEAWAEIFNNMGVASFMIDYFSGRDLYTIPDRIPLPRMNGMVDAYRALAVLASNRRIDPNRIAIMGISWGGNAELYSSLERFTKMYGPSNAQFAAHIGIYGGCDTTFRDDLKTTGKPIRLFHGLADDYVAIKPCQEYVKRLKSVGADVTLTELPDAMHAYDWPTLASTVPLPEALTLRGCVLEEGDNGAILNAKTGKVFAGASDPCIEKGTHLGYNAAAYKATVEGVTQFLKTTFKLQ
jgi:dienelactone hydrolase